MLLEFMDSKGLQTEGLTPKCLTDTYQELSQFHVIASLEGDVSEHIDEVPYHVVPIVWDVARCPRGRILRPVGDQLQQIGAVQGDVDLVVRLPAKGEAARAGGAKSAIVMAKGARAANGV